MIWLPAAMMPLTTAGASDRSAAQADVALVGDGRSAPPGDAQRRQVGQAAHRGGGLEAGAAELGVAVGQLEQVRARGADHAAARVPGPAILGGADHLAAAR